CSFDHSDTSPFLFKLFSLSRRANLVEESGIGKRFFQNFHALKQTRGSLQGPMAKLPLYPALFPRNGGHGRNPWPRWPQLTGRSALLLYLRSCAG
ncbi:MAG: hypothetical protein ACN6PK_18670, partial [Pseudomonas shirazensis]